VQVVDQIRDLDSVSHLVLPGVGAFGIVTKRRYENGLKDDINVYIQIGQPFLGICGGMQILFDIGFKNGINQGLGVIQGEVKNHLDDFSYSQLKIPNIGWSNVNRSAKDKKSEPFKGIPDSFYANFAHSYSANLVSDDKMSGYILKSKRE
jgi:imidazole glycerol-phosphate synthase subunit HisH